MTRPLREVTALPHVLLIPVIVCVNHNGCWIRIDRDTPTALRTNNYSSVRSVANPEANQFQLAKLLDLGTIHHHVETVQLLLDAVQIGLAQGHGSIQFS